MYAVAKQLNRQNNDAKSVNRQGLIEVVNRLLSMLDAADAALSC